MFYVIMLRYGNSPGDGQKKKKQNYVVKDR
jgi:hypothetical protein